MLLYVEIVYNVKDLTGVNWNLTVGRVRDLFIN